MFNDQALFDKALAELEEKRFEPVEPEPEAAVEEEPEPEPEVCPDFMYNCSNTGDCQREQLTKLCLRCDRFPRQDLVDVERSGCHNFVESYGGYNYGNCYEADKPECPNCAQYPREKWIFTQPVANWNEDEVVEFLETFGLNVKHGTGRWDLNNFAEKILDMIKAVSQIAAAKKSAL